MEYQTEYIGWRAYWLGVARVDNARTCIGDFFKHHIQRMTHTRARIGTYFIYSIYSIPYVYWVLSTPSSTPSSTLSTPATKNERKLK